MSESGTLAYFVTKANRMPITLPPVHERRFVCRCGAEKVFTGDEAQIKKQIIQSGWLSKGMARTALQEAMFGVEADCPRCWGEMYRSLAEVALARVL